jgi:glutamate racemase
LPEPPLAFEKGASIMDNRPIGVFDSGLGGLTVVKELLKQLPNESIVYFGDTARIPYGTRSREIVTRYSAQCIRFLMTRDIKMVVIACNTASSAGLDTLRDMFPIPIIGVVEPGAADAVKYTLSGRIGVIGTSGTIRSGAYRNAILSGNPNVTVVEEACTLFVPIVEEGWHDTDIASLTAEKYLYKLKKSDVDTVVLGCTHYPLLADTIQKVMGSGVRLVNPAEGTIRQVKLILEADGALRDTNAGPPELCFYVSDFGQKFQDIASSFLNMEIGRAERVDIEKY